jgi:hypothetical protein
MSKDRPDQDLGFLTLRFPASPRLSPDGKTGDQGWITARVALRFAPNRRPSVVLPVKFLRHALSPFRRFCLEAGRELPWRPTGLGNRVHPFHGLTARSWLWGGYW